MELLIPIAEESAAAGLARWREERPTAVPLLIGLLPQGSAHIWGGSSHTYLGDSILWKSDLKINRQPKAEAGGSL